MVCTNVLTTLYNLVELQTTRDNIVSPLIATNLRFGVLQCCPKLYKVLQCSGTLYNLDNFRQRQTTLIINMERRIMTQWILNIEKFHEVGKPNISSRSPR